MDRIEERLWETSVKSGQSALAQRQFGSARQSFEDALAIAEKFAGTDPRLPQTLCLLGMALCSQEDYTRAESVFKRALALSEKLWGFDSGKLLPALNGLGTVYLSEHSYPRALMTFNRALGITERERGKNHGDVAKVLKFLAAAYEGQNEWAGAKQVHQRIIQIFQQIGSPDLAKAENDLKALMRREKAKIMAGQDSLGMSGSRPVAGSSFSKAAPAQGAPPKPVTSTAGSELNLSGRPVAGPAMPAAPAANLQAGGPAGPATPNPDASRPAAPKPAAPAPAAPVAKAPAPAASTPAPPTVAPAAAKPVAAPAQPATAQPTPPAKPPAAPPTNPFRPGGVSHPLGRPPFPIAQQPGVVSGGGTAPVNLDHTVVGQAGFTSQPDSARPGVSQPGVQPAASSSATPLPAAAASAQPTGMPADPKELVGTVIDNRYELLEYIGDGGMSVVFKGRHRMMNKICAVKMLHAHLSENPTLLQRFQQEARTAAQMDHQNIVSTHDFGLANGIFYLVMDFVNGQSLYDLVADEGPLPVQRCVPILLQICEALHHAHESGVLHRDLKPSNVMLVKQGDEADFVKLVDFGLAKLVEEKSEGKGQVGSMTLTQAGEFVGSPLYMSPEQIRNHKVDARSDMYSWGCLAYECLTGNPPFGGETVVDVILQQMTALPPSFLEANPDIVVPPELETMIMKTLEKDPKERPASMFTLIQSLRDLAI